MGCVSQTTRIFMQSVTLSYNETPIKHIYFGPGRQQGLHRADLLSLSLLLQLLVVLPPTSSALGFQLVSLTLEPVCRSLG